MDTVRAPTALVAALLIALAAPTVTALPDPGLPGVAGDVDDTVPSPGIDDIADDPAGTATGAAPLPMDGCRWTGPGDDAVETASEGVGEALEVANGVVQEVRDHAEGPFQVWGVDTRPDPGVGCPMPPDPDAGTPGAPTDGRVARTPLGIVVDAARTDDGTDDRSRVEDPVVRNTGTDRAPARGGPSWPAILATAALVAAVPLWILYRRLRRDELLDHDGRRRAFEIVKGRPGATPAEVARRLDVHYETARHHLDVLVDFDLVARRSVGGRVHHFENGGRFAPDDKDRIAEARRAPRRAILDALAEAGALAAGDLSDRLGVAPSKLSYHLTRLVEADLLTREKDGRRRIYRISREGARLVDAL